ncbi:MULTISPECIES: hypothetical protein [unclassified Curtobacterium]|uniref:hypothetical protein n=1 Tax=unclassified Curtobacterium TaxID=257496 RepID=UPI000F4A0501|nr:MULTISPECIES: hypothetical protein [unclassified Curtobacterium]MBF4585544.1 hypothetical protein [Curtobacterium sp. VKM Ac-2887]ROS47453.1 hypothetical protein EDF53_0474 [Curtobacterium sp. PhB78]
MRAYVDESEPGGGRDHTTYVMAAVVITASACEAARVDVRAATPRRMRKLHWYEALPGQRLSWLDLLRRAVEIVVVRYEGAAARAERRRRRCLERLVWELEVRGVTLLVLESRGRARDDGDRSMFDALRRRGVGVPVRHEHVRGVDEPLVALADLACGAHVAGLDDELDSTLVRVG